MRVPAEGEAAPRRDGSVRGEEADAVTRWLVHDCGVGVPSVLISITGGAQDFRLPQNVQTAFERGLMRAARSGNTWMITGGTDTGVMRLVGQAIANYALDNVTAVGIGPSNSDQLAPHPAPHPPQSPSPQPLPPTLTLTRWESARGAPSPIATSLTRRRAASRVDPARGGAPRGAPPS